MYYQLRKSKLQHYEILNYMISKCKNLENFEKKLDLTTAVYLILY